MPTIKKNHTHTFITLTIMIKAPYSVTYSLDCIDRVVQDMLDYFLSDKKIWLLYGDLGAGKTTLIKSICKNLGVKSHVSSATYSIINEYLDKNNNLIYHCDFYRISNPQEAIDIGAEEILSQTKNYCFIEWPSNVQCLLPTECIILEIFIESDDTRKINLRINP